MPLECSLTEEQAIAFQSPTLFISGSIKIKTLDLLLLGKLQEFAEGDCQILIGDADGVDAAVQRYLSRAGVRGVVVYCTGRTPRNNCGDWPTKNIVATSKPGTRAYFTTKDRQMTEDCKRGLLIWDGRSTGTLSNVLELVWRGKPGLVFLNTKKEFLEINNLEDLEKLVSAMSPAALIMAEKTIQLKQRLESIKAGR